jgi:hypothetical protein
MKYKNPKYVYQIFLKGKPYRWAARFTVDGLKKYIGCFLTEAEALAAVEKARAKIKSKHSAKNALYY